ncbi:MAG: hypothetical protein LBC12_00285 [Nitrososphaerota archaeon]|nr:hypothetical protein [Nitrososphaerota archaeon]
MSIEKEQLNLWISKDVKNRITRAVELRCFRGITTVSGLVEKFILDALDEHHIPQELPKAEN